MVLDVALEPDDSASDASCVFCAIVRGDAPAEIVLHDPAGIAFLDRRPLLPGHVLLVPRHHVATLPDLPVDEVGPLFALAQRLTRAVPQATGGDGAFVAINNVVSQSVPHLHVHVVPRNRKDGLRGFFWPRTTYASDEDAAEVAERIGAQIAE
jgi:histidine triad (HIT) family protein